MILIWGFLFFEYGPLCSRCLLDLWVILSYGGEGVFWISGYYWVGCLKLSVFLVG